MADTHVYSIAGDPRQGFEIAKAALQELGFAVGAEEQPFTVTAERGSKGKTMMLGAWAGKKAQHLRVELRGMQQDGQNVIQLVPGTSGVAAGAIGVARANSAYGEIATALANKLYSAGILQATSVPTAQG